MDKEKPATSSILTEQSTNWQQEAPAMAEDQEGTRRGPGGSLPAIQEHEDPCLYLIMCINLPNVPEDANFLAPRDIQGLNLAGL